MASKPKVAIALLVFQAGRAIAFYVVYILGSARLGERRFTFRISSIIRDLRAIVFDGVIRSPTINSFINRTLSNERSQTKNLFLLR
ncbi:hypothetical protein [Nostoc sp.]|uniref:hypothetical protein n=1 Tax=Nostoc sp. TaxID=1180 RepID=UPI002FF84506